VDGNLPDLLSLVIVMFQGRLGVGGRKRLVFHCGDEEAELEDSWWFYSCRRMFRLNGRSDMSGSIVPPRTPELLLNLNPSHLSVSGHQFSLGHVRLNSSFEDT
jgi:hypothetical protein